MESQCRTFAPRHHPQQVFNTLNELERSHPTPPAIQRQPGEPTAEHLIQLLLIPLAGFLLEHVVEAGLIAATGYLLYVARSHGSELKAITKGHEAMLSK